MNPPVLEMNKKEAEDRAAAYELSRRRDAETTLAAQIFRLLADGKKLLDVGIAIREGGFDGKMRPKLAIARADRRQVAFEWMGHRDTATFNSNANRMLQTYPQMIERVNFNRVHGQFRRYADGTSYSETIRGYALVPMIPASVSLCGYRPMDLHILWEVEQWSDTPLLAVPDRDPYLLRRINGDLFEVLGEWDLTDVERYVMAGRARLQS